ncbi:hypothetical protein CEXT_643651 [Caerostris extrusa]|uniref:Transmembrane protein n=1 Tax=Caerostris extrusa TaxID=172846 RepID=A0AAV4XHU1_CAEEX|nr:hypothetical protein CEXT_643651 [Caerostris extrusa]
MEPEIANPPAEQDAAPDEPPTRDCESILKKNAVGLSVIGVVSIAAASYFISNPAVHGKTSKFYVEHNIIAAIITLFVGFAVILYAYKDVIASQATRFWGCIMGLRTCIMGLGRCIMALRTCIMDLRTCIIDLDEQQRTPDQGPEEIERLETPTTENVRNFINFDSSSMPQVLLNPEELRQELALPLRLPHHEPRMDLAREVRQAWAPLPEQPVCEPQQRRPELEQPSREEQQSPTNTIYFPTPLPFTEQLNPPEDERRPCSSYGHVPKRF